MSRWNVKKLLLSSLLIAAFLTGCSARSPEEFYVLPKQSDAYYDLQEAIDQVMKSGTVYCGPTSGTNQQPVQLVDLDGDGSDEAIVFLKTAGELPLKAYVFTRAEESYVNVAVLEGDGSGFDTVEYVQLDGEPGLEIVLGRRLGGQVIQALSAYSYSGDQMVEIMNCLYTEFKTIDLDGDARKDIFVIRQETEERVGVAELYRWQNGSMQREHEAGMSVGAKQIKRIITGNLEGNVPAVFVSSTYEEGTIITDIFAFSDSTFGNVATGSQQSVSAQMVRNYNVYPSDIDADGIVELPMPQVLPNYNVGDETQWVIDWYALDLAGGQRLKMTTYHNYSDGWYLELPKHWHDQITVIRSSQSADVTRYTISKWFDYDNEPREIFSIYVLSGQDRTAQAEAEGRFLLAEKGEAVYAAAFGTCDWAEELSQKDVNAMFRFIYADWDWGET